MKRGKLGRRGRIFRNFLLAGVLGALIWACAGWPVPARWELRRLEREAFLSPHSQFQGSVQDSWGDEVLIGLTPRWLVMGSPEEFRLWPRQGDGPALAPEPNAYYSISSMGPFGGWLVAADAPAGTASAVLTARLAGWYVMEGNDQHRRVDLYPDRDRDWPEGSTPAYWEKTYRIQGEPLGEGAFGFYLEAEDPYRGHIEIYAVREAMSWQLYQRTLHLEYISIQSQMTAVFYDAAGAELGRAELRDSRSRGT